MSKKKAKRDKPWSPEWVDSGTRLPEEGHLVVTRFGESDRETLNYITEGSWAILIEGEYTTIWWRVFTEKDLEERIHRMEGYALEHYINGDWNCLDIEKLYGIKKNEEK